MFWSNSEEVQSWKRVVMIDSREESNRWACSWYLSRIGTSFEASN